MQISDSEFLDALDVKIDHYEFSERVSMIVEHIDEPSEKQIDDAREIALTHRL
jgi:hypothetical protein